MKPGDRVAFRHRDRKLRGTLRSVTADGHAWIQATGRDTMLRVRIEDVAVESGLSG